MNKKTTNYIKQKLNVNLPKGFLYFSGVYSFAKYKNDNHLWLFTIFKIDHYIWCSNKTYFLQLICVLLIIILTIKR